MHHDVKRGALAEFARVLKPGGKAVVFEISDPNDDAAHVYPWPRATWIEEFSAAGFEVQRIVGDQYTPLLRGLKTAYTLARRGSARNAIEAMKHGSSGSQGSLLMVPLRAAVWLSYPVEEVARFLPPRFGRITGFLLEKGA